jgi:hypothetical protein
VIDKNSLTNSIFLKKDYITVKKLNHRESNAF